VTPDTAVLFDIDGTLVDSTYHHAIAWHRAFARHGLHPDVRRIHRTIGMGGDKLVTEVAGEDVEAELGDALRDAWREEYLPLREEVVPLAGAADLVRGLRAAGHRIALASSGDPQFSREAVDLLGIGDDIEVLTTSEDVEDSKPDPDLIGETLRRMGDPARAVFVGDTVHDVEAAARAGLPCLGLLSGGYGEAELSEAGAVLVVALPQDLIGVDWPV
jgi:HAD superfamily hydrolase (TIGR01549 family)